MNHILMNYTLVIMIKKKTILIKKLRHHEKQISLHTTQYFQTLEQLALCQQETDKQGTPLKGQ
jgi:hypothetical protein